MDRHFCREKILRNNYYYSKKILNNAWKNIIDRNHQIDVELPSYVIIKLYSCTF